MPLNLIDISIRHQILLEGLKVGQSNRLLQSVATLSTQLQTRLGSVDYENLGDMTKAELGRLLLDLRKIANKVFNKYLNDLIEWLNDYINVDRDFWIKALSEYRAEQFEEDEEKKDKAFWLPIFGAAPAVALLWSRAKNLPMGANGVLPQVFLEAYGANASARVSQLVAQAYANHETKAELIAKLRGTKEANLSDGLMKKLVDQGKAAQNSVIQHVAAQTNMGVGGVSFAQYLWVSVLDDRTTKICRSRNGHVYRYGEGPVPPAHINCRSSIVPWDGTGPADIPSFTVWANGQSREFLNMAFDGRVSETYEGTKAISLDQFRDAGDLITG